MTAQGERFDHVLLTRFSAVLSPGGPPPDEDWLFYRLGFFYDACLPSVLGQRGAKASWLILFDDRCSADFRREVETLADGAFTPLWTHEVFRRDSFAEPVVQRFDAPWLITTRLDSDDALAVDHLATVQTQFAEQDELFINFSRGLQVDRSGAVYRSMIDSSPFLSFIERRTPGQPPATVYVAKHARARSHAPVRQVRTPPMWLQVVHDNNVSNIVNGRQTNPAVVAQRFTIDLGYADSLSSRQLRRAQLGQGLRRARLWAAHPGELTKWAEATAWGLRGTHERPQNPGAPTLTDRVQRWELQARRSMRDARWRVKARANQLLPRRGGVVAGDVEDVLGRDRVVVLAEWSADSPVRADAMRAATAYANAGFGVLVVAARDPWTRLRVSSVPEGVAVVRRPNSAYDFGSWAHALQTWPRLAAKDLVILTNDSLVGPLGPLDELLRRIEASTAEVWAPAMATLPALHLHSFLLAFRGGVLGRPALRDFFAAVRPLDSKKAVIEAYEIGLTRTMEKEGLGWDVGWDHDELKLAPSAILPLAGWRALLEGGFPFVKRVLLTGPQFAHLRPGVEQAVRDGLAPTPDA